MRKENLLCLQKCPNGMWLELIKVDSLKKDVADALELNLEKKVWRYIAPGGYIQSKDWKKIGESNSHEDKTIQLVFDPADFKQLEYAFSVASHYYSDNARGD